MPFKTLFSDKLDLKEEPEESVESLQRLMDPREREALAKCRKDIEVDLDVNDIIDFLIDRNVVNDEAQKIIFEKNSMADQTSAFLEILPKLGPDAFVSFVKSLKEDYYWLAEKLEDTLDAIELPVVEDTFDSGEQDTVKLRKLLMLGGVPSLPSHNVIREEKMAELREKIADLNPGQFLAIHGMPGSGKSVLASGLIHNPDVTLSLFPDGVFWFRVGMLESDALLHRMKILCEKIDASIVPLSIDHARDIFIRHFSSEKFSRTLVILDDVWSMDVIHAFTICARIVVTTRDISVLDKIPNQDKKVVEIEAGFSQEESLELFSKCVGLGTEFLPEEAKLIHEEAKGSPMVIALIGSFISENSRHSSHRQSGRWAYYLSNLQQRRYSKFRKQNAYEYDGLLDAVEVSVQNLPENLKERYIELAVFQDDVAISQSVLMTYWRMNQFEVEDIMAELKRRAMANVEHDDTLDCDVYTIHDLHLEYLKSLFKDDEEKEIALHKKFLDCYFHRVGNDYGKIVDDSYIYYNLGYHLFKSEQFDLFPKIFLDLSFVESMLKATSSVDLLNDYKRYGNYIINNSDDNLGKLEDFEAFARTIGALVSCSEHTDIIQLALREPEESAVYQAAKKLAQNQPERLYLEWLNRDRVRGHHSATILHHGSVEDACFLPDMTKILTTNGDGQIKIWDVTSGEVLHRFTGHMSAVRTLSVSPIGDTFASGSEDGTIKIWDLGSFVDDSYNGHEKQHAILRKGSVRGRSTGSPNVKKQTVGQLVTGKSEVRDLSNQSFIFNELHNESVLCVAFSPDGEEVVAAGQSGLVKVFNIRARALRLTLNDHKEAVNVSRFSGDGRYICTGSNDGSIRLWEVEDGKIKGAVDRHDLAILDLVFVPETTKVFSMSSDKLFLWNAPSLHSSPYQDITEFRRSRTADFVCMRVSNNGRLLAAATVDNIVTIWDVSCVQVVLALPGHSSFVHALDFTHDDMFLLSGSSDETVMIWTLESLSDQNAVLAKAPPSLGLGPVFDVKFLGENLARMVALDDTNSIQVIEDGKLIYQSPAETTIITAISLSENGDIIAYGCQHGSVRIFYPSSGTIKTLGFHPKVAKITDLKIRTFVNEVEISPIVVSAAEDGSVKIWYEGGATFDCNGHRFKAKEVHFVDVSDSHLVLSRSTNGTIRTWNLMTGDTVSNWSVTDEPIRTTLTCIDISSAASLVAAGTASGRVILLNLLNLRSEYVIEPQQEFGPVRVIRFNHDGSQMVTGHDTGYIESRPSYGPTRKHSCHKREARSQQMKVDDSSFCSLQVWETKSRSKLYSMIPVHQSWVTDVKWSRDSLNLVTIGDKLAWWTFQFMPRKKNSVGAAARKKSLQFNRRSRAESQNERRSYTEQGSNTNDLAQALSQLGSGGLSTANSAPNISNIRVVKEGLPKNRELLQVFDIRGGAMSKVFVSQDFTKFVTLDDAGSAYFLQEIDAIGN